MPLDEADKKFIQDLLKANNEAFAERFATPDQVTKIVGQNLEELNLGEQIKTSLDDSLKDIREQLSKSDKGGAGGDDGGRGGAGDGADEEQRIRLAKMQEELEHLQQQNRAAEEARQKAEQREKANRLTSAVRDALSKAGVPTDKHHLAIPVLQSSKLANGKPLISLAEDGSPRYLAQRNGYTEKLSMADGIAEWAESDDGKIFLPPTNTAGTGEGGGQRPPASGHNRTPRNQDGSANWNAIGQNLSTASLGRATGS